MKSIVRRGVILSVAVAAALFALVPALGNAPFSTRDVATGILNPNGVPSVMKLDSAGRPVFAFFSGYEGSPGFGSVDVIRCADTTCSTSTRNTVVDSIPADTSLGLVLDGAGNPLVAYSYDVPGSVSVRVVRCEDLACASVGPESYLEAGTAPALHVFDVHISPGNLPAAVTDHPGEYLLYSRCTAVDCSSSAGALITNVQGVDADAGLTYGTNNLAVISFQSNGLRAAFCSSAVCGSNNITLRDIDTANANTGFHSTVEIHPSSGFPVFAYSDGATGDLKIAFCSDSQCVNAPTIQTLATEGTQGRGISLDFEGNTPVVVSRTTDAGAQAIRWIRCLDTACTNTLSYVIDGPSAGLGSTPPSLDYVEDPDIGHRIGFFDRDEGTLKLLYASPGVGNGSDVDCNGEYDAVDALIIARALAGLPDNSSAIAPCDLDLNNDNQVNILDLLLMRVLAAGLIHT